MTATIRWFACYGHHLTGWAKTPAIYAAIFPNPRKWRAVYTCRRLVGNGCLISGMEQEGWELLNAMLPSGRNEDIFKTEPYVITADVYSNSQNVGRGGWSWYTGAAGGTGALQLRNCWAYGSAVVF